MNGKKTNNYDALIVKRSIMCKLLRCLPSELEEEDFDDIEYIEIISKNIGKDNPLWLI